VRCILVTGKEAFEAVLETEEYDFIFIASFLFSEAREIVRARGIKATLVLLAEYGEVLAEKDTRFIAMPVHSISIANILNGEEESVVYEEDEHKMVRFTAPSARILAVDDIRTNLNVVAGLLAPYEMTIDTCLSGAEAIRLVQENRYDLVLMDHMMLEMDGIETTKAIRTLPGDYFQTLPIAALTANAITGMKDMFLEMGFHDYISKPIEIVKLDELIAKWIPPEKKIKTGGVIKRENFRGETGMVIPGVDVRKGINMTGGTLAGYCKVLAQFYKDASERLPWFKDFSAEKDLENNDKFPAGKLDREDFAGNLPALTAQAHAIKSAAGTIGAAEVSNEAAALEAAGKAGDTETIVEKLPEFYAHLSELVTAIGEVFESEKSGVGSEVKAATSLSELHSSFLSLKTALEVKNIEKIDRIIGELEAVPLDAETREKINAVSDKVLISDYAAALDCISQLEGLCGIH
jgi:CheY-like chemotaxis protein